MMREGGCCRCSGAGCLHWADWYVTAWADARQLPSFPCRLKCFPALFISLSRAGKHTRFCLLLYVLFPLSSLQSAWRHCLYQCCVGRATVCSSVSLLKSAEALHLWPESASVQVIPAEKGMVMSLGGSLNLAFQEELENLVRLALVLLSICHF